MWNHSRSLSRPIEKFRNSRCGSDVFHADVPAYYLPEKSDVYQDGGTYLSLRL
jgi:hypothetical protein